MNCNSVDGDEPIVSGDHYRRVFDSIAVRWDPLSGKYSECRFGEISINPLDLGMLYGAVVVERMRTFRSQLPGFERHWERFQRGCSELGIESVLSPDSFRATCQQLVSANAEWMQSESDLSISMVATPGNPDASLDRAMIYMHCLPLPWRRLAEWYRMGTSLVSSRYSTGAGSGWPAPIKVRNRLAYYLADRDAEAQSPGSLGLVCTVHGTIGDTSVANLLMVDPRGNWVTPSGDSVHLGTSLRISERLLHSQGISVDFRDVGWEELHDAEEMILVGNSGCVWHVSQVNGVPIGDGQRGRHCERLQQRWIEYVGFDWLTQALHRGS